MAEEKISYDDDLYTIIEKVNRLLPSEVEIEIVDKDRADGCEVIRIK